MDHNTVPFISTYGYGYEDEIDYEEPLVSGPIKNMPWDDDMFFGECKEKNNTPILMAAYRTVLKDPLPGEEFNVHLAASLLCGTVVKPGEVLSQNMLLGPYTKEKGYREGPTYIGSRLTTTVGGGVCKISSTLYNLAILSNLQIIERHSHSMPVPYVPYGQDATVAYGVKDFKLRNNTDFPVMIWAQGIDNILYMAFYSMQEPSRIEWHHEILETREAPCIYKTNTTLADVEEKIIVEGMDGAIVKSWISIYNSDGSVTTRQLGISSYLPMPYIIERNK
jgi:vancomycin resistance protein VanW